MYIGVVGRYQKESRPFYSFNAEIAQVIQDYHALILPFIFDFKKDAKEEFLKYKPLIDMCSGFILQGGSDYEDIDLKLVQYLHEKQVPTLGICLGMQTMAMAFSGKMGSVFGHKKEGYVHPIVIKMNTRLYEILKKRCILVNSRHRDYILTTSLDISSRYDIIESVEDSLQPFFIGVQWHPETLRDENSEKIFTEFFKNAQKYKKS